jgi:hypothetical protein
MPDTLTLTKAITSCTSRVPCVVAVASTLMKRMTMKLITEKVLELGQAEFDINVWSEAGTVYLTFYPLRYPGDSDYPDRDLAHGFPVLDTSRFYSLSIPSDARGPRYRDALAYLASMVECERVEAPELYPVPLWDGYDGMDWWSSETLITDPPALIREFLATLPRRERKAK